MRQIMKRVTFRYSAGATFVIASLLYLASCQSGANIKPISPARADSTNALPHIMSDDDDPGPDDPPKKPGGPGCCQ